MQKQHKICNDNADLVLFFGFSQERRPCKRELAVLSGNQSFGVGNVSLPDKNLIQIGIAGVFSQGA